MKMSHKQATADIWQTALKNVIKVTQWFAIAAICVGFLATGAGYSIAAVETGRAVGRAAVVRANLISLDKVTRQYPVYLQYQAAGRYALVNPNTNSVTMLDTRSELDRQMIAAVSGVQIAGVIAQEARKSKDPAGISIMKPPIVHAQE